MVCAMDLADAGAISASRREAPSLLHDSCPSDEVVGGLFDLRPFDRTAMLRAGHEVEIFELRPFVGGKVSSWKDKEGNHIEMGLHVFFGCYYNLFGIMERTGSYDLLRMKEHIHTFVNKGGELGALDFRFPVGAPVSGLQAFARTEQLGWGDKAANALRLGTSPIVRALVDFDGGMDMVRDLDDITFTEWFTSFGRRRGVR